MVLLKGDFFIWSMQCLGFGFSKFSYIFIHTKHTFLLLCDFLSGTCWKKFPIVSKVLRFHGFPVTEVHNVSHGPVKNVIFPFVNAIFAVRILQIFVHIYAYKTYLYFVHFQTYKSSFITYLFRPTIRTVNNCSQDSPNFHTYLCIQNVPLFCTFLDLQNDTFMLVPIAWPFGPRGTNLNNGCRKSNLTQQNQSLPMPIKT